MYNIRNQSFRYQYILVPDDSELDKGGGAYWQYACIAICRRKPETALLGNEMMSTRSSAYERNSA